MKRFFKKGALLPAQNFLREERPQLSKVPGGFSRSPLKAGTFFGEPLGNRPLNLMKEP